MNVRRFRGANMREVMNRVRDDLGPDAMILDTREIDDGIEVSAVADYDEAASTAIETAGPENASCTARVKSAG